MANKTPIAWLLLALSVGPAAVPATTASAQANDQAPPELSIGDLAHRNEDGRWLLREVEAGRSYRIGCRALDCGSDLIDIGIDPGGADSCSPAFVSRQAGLAQPMDDERIGLSKIERPGFTLQVALVDLGCRNWTGSPVFACTSVAGDLYSFSAYAGGCRDTPPDFDRPVLEFLNGLTLKQN